MNVFKKCLTLFLTACVCMTALLSCGTGNEDTPAATTAATTLSPEEIPARPTQDQSYEETVRNAFSNVAEPDAERFTYAVLESGVTLTGYTGDLPRLKLPSEIEGKPVVAIADGAFANSTQLTVLVIPQTVQSIGKEVLKGCTSLVALKTPLVGADANSAQYLGYLFGAASYEMNSRDVPVSLEILEITEGLTALAKYALYDCNDLLAVKLPQSIKTLESYSMFRCERLQYVNVSELTAVAEHALDNCNALKILEFGASLT